MLKNLGVKSVKSIVSLVIKSYVKGIMAIIMCLTGLLGGVSALGKARQHKEQIRAGVVLVSFAGLFGGLFVKAIDVAKDINEYGFKWFFNETFGAYVVPTVICASLIFYGYKLYTACKNRFDENTNILLSVAEFVGIFGVIAWGGMTENLTNISYILIAYPIVKFLIVNRLPVVVNYVQENAGEMIETVQTNVAENISTVTENINNIVSDNASDDVVESEEVQVTVAMDLAEKLESEEKEDNIVNPKVPVQEAKVAVKEANPTLGVAKTSNGSLLSIFRNASPSKKAPDRKVKTPKLQESIKEILKDIEY